jgi:hypothetical protein
VATTGWDALLQASGILFNSGTWISVPCASKPETSFLFHACVLGSGEHQAYTAEQLLLRCTKVLHALLSLSPADTSPDGVLDMEACLGDAGFSDALSHLAVLASAHLHSRLERADHGFDVEMLDDGSTGLSATIALQGDVAGKIVVGVADIELDDHEVFGLRVARCMHIGNSGVHNIGTKSKQAINNAVHVSFVARNCVARENNGVVVTNGDELVVAACQQTECCHWLTL